MKRNLTTLFRLHIPLLFALGGGSSREGEGWRMTQWQPEKDSGDFWRVRGVLSMSLHLKPLSFASSEAGRGGRQLPHNATTACTHTSSPFTVSLWKGVTWPQRYQPSPSNEGQSKSMHPATPSNSHPAPLRSLSCKSRAPKFPLSELLECQGCQLLLAEERHFGLKSKGERDTHGFKPAHYLRCTHSFWLQTWPSDFRSCALVEWCLMI